ncbi:MAG: hypothetical protein ACOZQL_34800 [Myxococcota bacterium]
MSWGLIRVQDQLALVFAYTDPQAGPSAKGTLLTSTEPTTEDARAAATRPNVTVRLGAGLQLRPLPEPERERLALPDEPEWLVHFRPPPSGAWSTDPFFRGRFHPDFPNDIQALFFFLEEQKAERMWVRLERETGVPGVYEGALLNTAHARPELSAGTPVRLRGAPGAKGPLWLTDVMATNAAEWLARCEACGFDLVLEPVPQLLARTFPDAPPGTEMTAFTTRCAMCQQTQLVQRRSSATLDAPEPSSWSPAKLALVLVPVVLGLALLGWVFLGEG